MPVLTASERLGTFVDDKYRIESLLGHGGMGVVFEATHTWTNRRVAIKLLKPDMVEPARDARLLIEARAATSLAHPNVVQVLDMGMTSDGVSYLVMELLQGRTLRDELLARGPLPAADALRWVLPLIGAMAIAHERGIVHRDLKPANIFLYRDAAGHDVPKLLDFGVAKVIEETGATRSGVVLGTPAYLSPEQAAGDHDVGPAADLWAFGVILYECLSGRVPFVGTTAASVLQRIVNEPAPALRSQAPALGSALAAAIDRALRTDPAARYPDLRSFARALLATARADGVVLPAAPDPLGLPDWSRWQSEEAQGVSTTLDVVAPRAPLAAAVPVPAQPALPRLLPAERPRRARTTLVIGASLLIAGVATAYLLRPSHAEVTNDEARSALRTAAPAALPAAPEPSATIAAPNELAPPQAKSPAAVEAAEPARELGTSLNANDAAQPAKKPAVPRAPRERPTHEPRRSAKPAAERTAGKTLLPW